MTSSRARSRVLTWLAAGSSAWACATGAPVIRIVAAASNRIGVRRIGSGRPGKAGLDKAGLDNAHDVGGVQPGLGILLDLVVVVLEQVGQGQGADRQARPHQVVVGEEVEDVAA